MIRIVCWRDMRYYVSLWNNNIYLNSDINLLNSVEIFLRKMQIISNFKNMKFNK